jgi:hypothetical protein
MGRFDGWVCLYFGFQYRLRFILVEAVVSQGVDNISDGSEFLHHFLMMAVALLRGSCLYPFAHGHIDAHYLFVPS